MTILSKSKKSVGLEDEITYFIDKQQLANWDHENLPILEKGNFLIRTYKNVTGFPIENIEQFKALCSDPMKCFKEQYYAANEKEFASLVKLKLDFSSMIPIPENFGEVTKACSKFSRHTSNLTNLILENGELYFTEAFLEKKDRRYRCAARTPEEKERLRIANDIIKSLQQLEPLLTDRKFEDAKKFKRFAFPLPYPVRLVQNDNGLELSPNNKFIDEGFAGTNFLGFYVSTRSELKHARLATMPKLDVPKWVKWYRPLLNGGKRLYTCLADEFDKHKIEADELLDGYFTEDGRPWGVVPDTRATTIKETFYQPLR